MAKPSEKVPQSSPPPATPSTAMARMSASMLTSAEMSSCVNCAGTVKLRPTSARQTEPPPVTMTPNPQALTMHRPVAGVALASSCCTVTPLAQMVVFGDRS